MTAGEGGGLAVRQIKKVTATARACALFSDIARKLGGEDAASQGGQ